MAAQNQTGKNAVSRNRNTSSFVKYEPVFQIPRQIKFAGVFGDFNSLNHMHHLSRGVFKGDRLKKNKLLLLISLTYTSHDG